jgi:hypothetical protein
LKKAVKVIVVSALMLSIGLHWVALQTAAFIGMAFNYTAASGSLVQGVEETFDGDHPCELCKLVMEQQGATEEKESPPGKDAEKAPKKSQTVDSIAQVWIGCEVVILPRPNWPGGHAERLTAAPELPPPRV